jgi:hypothetical protein
MQVSDSQAQLTIIYKFVNLINQILTNVLIQYLLFLYLFIDEMGQNRKLYIPVPPDQRCKRGRMTFEVMLPNPERKAQNDPRCHNYL